MDLAAWQLSRSNSFCRLSISCAGAGHVMLCALAHSHETRILEILMWLSTVEESLLFARKLHRLLKRAMHRCFVFIKWSLKFIFAGEPKAPVFFDFLFVLDPKIVDGERLVLPNSWEALENCLTSDDFLLRGRNFLQPHATLGRVCGLLKVGVEVGGLFEEIVFEQDLSHNTKRIPEQGLPDSAVLQEKHSFELIGL